MTKETPLCYLSTIQYESDYEKLFYQFDTKGRVVHNSSFHVGRPIDDDSCCGDMDYYDWANTMNDIASFYRNNIHIPLKEICITYIVVYNDFVFSVSITDEKFTPSFDLIEFPLTFLYDHCGSDVMLHNNRIDDTVSKMLDKYALPDFYYLEDFEGEYEEEILNVPHMYFLNKPNSTPIVYASGCCYLNNYDDELYAIARYHSPIIFKYDADLNRLFYRTSNIIRGTYYEGIGIHYKEDSQYCEKELQLMGAWESTEVIVNGFENDDDIKTFHKRDEILTASEIKTYNDVICHDIFASKCFNGTLIKPNYLVFDTETTGTFETQAKPRIVQLAWALFKNDGTLIEENSFIIEPDNFLIPPEASSIHGITTDIAKEEGASLFEALVHFSNCVHQSEIVIGHNLKFDINVLKIECEKLSNPDFGTDDVGTLAAELLEMEQFCTMKIGTNYCEIEGRNGYKWPKLSELYYKLFETDFPNAHNALADVRATAKCYFEMKKRGIIKPYAFD